MKVGIDFHADKLDTLEKVTKREYRRYHHGNGLDLEDIQDAIHEMQKQAVPREDLHIIMSPGQYYDFMRGVIDDPANRSITMHTVGTPPGSTYVSTVFGVPIHVNNALRGAKGFTLKSKVWEKTTSPLSKVYRHQNYHRKW